MALSPGTQLGPYEIVAPAGAGGMGEVYRARDTRLGREVAIKILPQHLAASADLRARLDREARAISALQHPHICTLYDIGHQDGVDFLVMEFLEGETLAKRLESGALKADELVGIAVQVAQALGVAHRRGIVHRDLKPGNVMLTRTGAKLMDFGLAKPAALVSAASGSAPMFSAAATITSPASPITQQGMVVGTVQYMSPEQVQGKDADARSDIFSFGAMLYEMATGKRAFEGKSQLSVASAILEREPEPISAVQPLAPAALEAVISACLQKDPEERLQSAHDLKLQLQWVARAPAAAAAAASRTPMRWMVAPLAILAVAVMALGVVWLRQKPPESMAVRASILPPPPMLVDYMALSPDGRWLALVMGNPARDDARIFLRRLDSGTFRQLPGTEGARTVFWSHDQRSLGYFSLGKLHRVDIDGGPATVLAETGFAGPGSWSARDEILFTEPGGRILRISALGGKPEPVYAEQRGRAVGAIWLPDGEHFLFYRMPDPGAPGERGIYVGSVSSPESSLLVAGAFAPQLSAEHLLYVRDAALFAQPFAAGSRRLSGSPVVLLDRITVNRFGFELFSTSATAGLVFLDQSAIAGGSLVWFDAKGKATGRIGEVLAYANPTLSPDARRLAVDIDDPADLWIYDLERDLRTRFTFDPGADVTPVWSPDGSRIAYANHSADAGKARILIRNSSGLGETETVWEDFGSVEVESWSPDGRHLLFTQYRAGQDIWLLPLEGERKAVPFLNGSYLEREAAFSADGKWVAYMSTESGREEVYITSFPARDRKWQISIGEGDRPRWRRDGRRLFYLSNTDVIMAVDLDWKGEELRISKPVALFETRARRPGAIYQVTPDGSRFLVVDRGDTSSIPVTLITDWRASLAPQRTR